MKPLVPELGFDATDIPRLFYQDELILEYDCFLDVPQVYSNRTWGVDRNGRGSREYSEPVWDPEMSDDELARHLEALRQAICLPLSDRFLTLIGQLLDFAEDAARRRYAARGATKAPSEEWRTADLLSEVQAVCGEGRQSGKQQWFFRCCFHPDDDTPSLHVDPGTNRWWAFCCGKGGGVYDWRRLVKRT